jgi:formylmethanofuran dehydrogenase subunit E
MQAYRELSDSDLFREQWVRVELDASDLPGYKGEREMCARCGEGVNFGRSVPVGGERLCLACADPAARYWRPVDEGD